MAFKLALAPCSVRTLRARRALPEGNTHRKGWARRTLHKLVASQEASCWSETGGQTKCSPPPA
eukprot:3663084-Rhodomonas_salina.1